MDKITLWLRVSLPKLMLRLESSFLTGVGRSKWTLMPIETHLCFVKWVGSDPLHG